MSIAVPCVTFMRKNVAPVSVKKTSPRMQERMARIRFDFFVNIYGI